MKEMAERLKTLRQDQGWTQEYLTQRLGVALRTLQRWEGGKSQPSEMAMRLLQDLEEKVGRRISEAEILRRITREISRTLQGHNVTWREEEIKALAERVYRLTKE